MSNEQTTQERRRKGRGRKVFWAIVAFGAALALLSVTPGFGRRDGHRDGHRGGHGKHSPEALLEALSEDAVWLRHLDLSDGQRREIGALIGELGPTIQRFESERQEISGRFAELLLAESPDAEKVEATRAAAQRLSRQAVDRTIDAALAFAEVLTPEQRAELVAHWRER